MNIEIENWAKKNLTDNAIELMKESVTCYKIGAYRSAYLMSYLAFKQTIRERILMAPVYPECYNNRIEWDRNVLNLLRNDDKWEDFINEIVEANSDEDKLSNIFIYTNRKRCLNRYNYWRDIRNSCAHAKEEHINSATVEQFWNYIQDDLSELYVLGGKKYLMSELIDSYKYYISDNYKDISNLLIDISVVYKNALKEFFLSFLDELMVENRILINELNCKFWGEIIFSNDDSIKEAFVLSVYEKKETFLGFYKYHPTILKLILSTNSRFIQDYINPLLCKELCYNYTYKTCFWGILRDSLAIQPKSIDISCITNNYENFKMIEYLEEDEYGKALLNQYDIFKNFIFGAGNDLFNNDSSNHWDYYSYNSTHVDSYVIRCFDFVNWDMELIDRVNSSFEYLHKNVESRSNPASICNGNTRISAYKTIISNNIDKIQKTCDDNSVDLERYVNIKEVVSGN